MSLALAFAAVIFASANAPASSMRAIELHNVSSRRALTALYLAPAEGGTWSANILGGDQIFPGEVLMLSDVPRGTYDMLMIDERGGKCTLKAVDFVTYPIFAYTGSDCGAR